MVASTTHACIGGIAPRIHAHVWVVFVPGKGGGKGTTNQQLIPQGPGECIVARSVPLASVQECVVGEGGFNTCSTPSCTPPWSRPCNTSQPHLGATHHSGPHGWHATGAGASQLRPCAHGDSKPGQMQTNSHTPAISPARPECVMQPPCLHTCCVCCALQPSLQPTQPQAHHHASPQVAANHQPPWLSCCPLLLTQTHQPGEWFHPFPVT
jgi:hypothetical protein